VREQLLTLSAGTADRLLRPDRQPWSLTTTRPGRLLKKQIDEHAAVDRGSALEFDPLSDPLSGERCEPWRPSQWRPASTFVLILRLGRTLAKAGDRDEHPLGFDS
jgi:hypothetical protein